MEVARKGQSAHKH